ncbi:transposase [Trueperella pyogenes]|uniref:transposase n=1 Tax=Trueperella pyogenes TaxID=1661 RepID=UPI003D2FE1EE
MAVNTCWWQTAVHQCVVHLIGNTFRHAGRQDCKSIVRTLKARIYGRKRGRCADSV